MLRLFVALELPADLRARLAGLKRPLPRARWVGAENHHLSLRFIGEVSDEQAADIDAELARIDAPAFELSLAGIGEFSSGDRVRTLWVGIEPAPLLMALQIRIENALQRAGLPPDGRRFAAHVTLARLKDAPLARIAPFLAAHSRLRAGPIEVDRFVLFSSILQRSGPTYTAERTYTLAGGSAAFAELAAEWDAPD